MSDNVVYSDKLLEINEHSVLFHDYYYPFGSKRVNFAEVESVTIVKPTLSSGKYRLYGTGDFRTWFPPDGSRSSRDKIGSLVFCVAAFSS